jgi:hypothetical protein
LQCELIEGFAWIKAKKGPKMITLRIPIYWKQLEQIKVTSTP